MVVVKGEFDVPITIAGEAELYIHQVVDDILPEKKERKKPFNF